MYMKQDNSRSNVNQRAVLAVGLRCVALFGVTASAAVSMCDTRHGLASVPTAHPNKADWCLQTTHYTGR